MDSHSQLLRRAFDAAVGAANPDLWLKPALETLEPPAGTVRVIALGKAAVPMAETFARTWRGPWSGLAVAPAGSTRTVDGFLVLEGAHPVPDGRSAAAGDAALAFARGGGPDDLLLVLMSGGASALACAPIPGVSLAQKAEATRRLLISGAGIGELNTVRRALSRLKGGGLARATGAGRVLTLAMSDVPGDRLADIGSGPGVPSPTGADEALAILRNLTPELAGDLVGPVEAWGAGLQPVVARVEGRVALPLDGGVRAVDALLAMAGWPVEQLGVIGGDVGEACERHLRRLADGRRRAVVSGGELSVAVPPGASGRGGRNQHFLLCLAASLAGRGDVWGLAADTDGIDGSSPAAGAWLDPGLLATLDADEARIALGAFDAHGFFAKRGRLVETGPTGVNVGDLRILLVDPAAVS
jgi:hydroxypyruvate reductase